MQPYRSLPTVPVQALSPLLKILSLQAFLYSDLLVFGWGGWIRLVNIQ